MFQKTVSIQRDDQNELGLRISGAKPVLVEYVKYDSIAWNSGFRLGDQIIEINGRSVIDCTHDEVAQMMRLRGDELTLTLIDSSKTLNEFEKFRLSTIKSLLALEQEFLMMLKKSEKYLNEKKTKINSTLNRIKELEEQLSSTTDDHQSMSI